MIVDYLERHGRMGALYTDRASHFGNQRRTHRGGIPLEEREAEMANSIIRHALTALGAELILALSPQAKGRVERLFKTLQDRLLKELRVAAVSSLAEANRFLEEVFLPFWNERFTVTAAEPVDAHRPVPPETDLDALFAEKETRVIREDFTFRYHNRFLQIDEHEADPGMPKARVLIEKRLDGSLRCAWRGRYLARVHPTTEPSRRPSAPPPAPPVERPLSGAAGRPVPPDHPWRRFPVRVGRGRFLPPGPSWPPLRYGPTPPP